MDRCLTICGQYLGAFILAFSLLFSVGDDARADSFIRGDSDANGLLQITDGVRVFGFLFLGNPLQFDCPDAADVDDSGILDISDGIYALNFLFTGGPPPISPYPDCGVDLTADDLDCASYPLCVPPVPPRAALTATPDYGQAPIEVSFDATASSDEDGEIVEYDWDFGDGEGAAGAVVTHTYTSSGIYTAVLTVVDDSGEQHSAEARVVVTPAAPDVTPPASPTRADRVTLEGTAGGDFTVRVVSEFDQSAVETTASAAGAFSIELTLQPNILNRFLVLAVDGAAQESPPVAVEIVHDGEAPFLFVDEPAAASEVTTETVTVLGRVADRLSGHEGLEVTVDGVAAAVIIGIGTNGTFERSNVPLTLGENTIVVEASDVLGNSTRVEHSVTRVAIPEGVPTITVLEGNNQVGPMRSTLAEPIVVGLAEAVGEPFSGKLVTLRVTRSDGQLATSAAVDAERSQLLQVRTDAEGRASAFWTLGSDAGCGNNRVEVTSTSVVGTTNFCASATAAPPDRILVGSGNNQRVEAGAVAQELLKVWVSDGCNGSAGVPVTFTVTGGAGSFESGDAVDDQGRASLTVETTETGHAEVAFRLGHEAGTQLVEASFDGNPGLPARFASFAVVRDESEPTSFSALVLDSSFQPIEGASCALLLAKQPLQVTRTDADGAFSFDDLPATGPARVFVYGMEATHVGGREIPPGSFPALSYDVVLVPNVRNSLTGPVLLPGLDPVNARSYDGTEDVELTVEGVGGLRMVVKVGSVRRPDGSQPSPEEPMTLSLNQVHRDDVPMPMPDGAAPAFAWTLQPAGATFDPPVEVTYPNLSALPPGAAAFFLSFDHDTGRFEIVASGQVTSDGASILSDPGVGIRKAGWGGNCPPYPNTASVSRGAGPGGGFQTNCDDGDPCTEDRRHPELLVCLNTPIDCDDGDPETSDECVDGVCVHTRSCDIAMVGPVGAVLCEEVTFSATGRPSGGTYSWSGGTPVGSTNSRFYTVRFDEPGSQSVRCVYDREDCDRPALGELFVNVAAQCDLTTFEGEHFENAAVVHSDFVEAMSRIDAAAGDNNVRVRVTASFEDSTLTSAAAVPAADRSNHFVGHAIDIEVIDPNGGVCDTSCLTGPLPQGVDGFIQAIRDDPALRWGGDFKTPDVAHIDDGLDQTDSEGWEEKFDRVQCQADGGQCP